MAKRGRPIGTGKPAGEKFILKTIKVPPELWEQFASLVAKSERAETIRGLMRQEIKRRQKVGTK
jgi:hypothetical protein